MTEPPMVVPITLVHEKTVYHVTLPTPTIAALRDAVEEATTVIGHGARLIVKGKTLPSTGPCPPPSIQSARGWTTHTTRDPPWRTPTTTRVP